jgi:DNA-binding GntR family transcriptional regulator
VDRAECDYLRHVSETARPVCFRFLEESSRETAETAHRRTAAEHRAIVAALEQSEDAAESAMRAHVAGARERLVTALRETEGATAPSGAMP